LRSEQPIGRIADVSAFGNGDEDAKGFGADHRTELQES
jgi:hypothetical protein